MGTWSLGVDDYTITVNDLSLAEFLGSGQLAVLYEQALLAQINDFFGGAELTLNEDYEFSLNTADGSLDTGAWQLDDNLLILYPSYGEELAFTIISNNNNTALLGVSEYASFDVDEDGNNDAIFIEIIVEFNKN